MKQQLILGWTVSKVTVLIHRGQEDIDFEISGGPLTHPTMPSEPTYFKVRTSPGRSKEWLRQMDVDLSLVTVISAKLGQLPGFPESYD